MNYYSGRFAVIREIRLGSEGEVIMQGKMKAGRFYKVGEPLKIDTIPIPKLEPGDVLVDIKACGICGSDIHIVYRE